MYEATDNYPYSLTFVNVKGNVFEFRSAFGMASSMVYYLTSSNVNIRIHVWNYCMSEICSKQNRKHGVTEYPL